VNLLLNRFFLSLLDQEILAYKPLVDILDIIY
jgi:hypothetical protein